MNEIIQQLGEKYGIDNPLDRIGMAEVIRMVLLDDAIAKDDAMQIMADTLVVIDGLGFIDDILSYYCTYEKEEA